MMTIFTLGDEKNETNPASNTSKQKCDRNDNKDKETVDQSPMPKKAMEL